MVRLLLIFFIFSVSILNAQRVVTYAITPAGGSFVTDGMQGVYNVGELANGTKKTSKFTVHEGLVNQQIQVEITSLIEEELADKFMVYPNPVGQILNINWEKAQQEKFTFHLFDMKGKLLQSAVTNGNQNQLIMDMESFDSGLYFIIIEDYNKNQLIRLKIIKNETND